MSLIGSRSEKLVHLKTADLVVQSVVDWIVQRVVLLGILQLETDFPLDLAQGILEV